MTSRKTYTRLFREQFVEIWYRTQDEVTFGEHCERLGVSRETGYEWLKRYERDNANGLETRSSAPHHCPHETNEGTAALLIAARKEHPTWGPRKLKVFISTVLRGEVIGLSTQDESTADVFFGPVLLGRLCSDKPELGLMRKPDDAD